MQKSCCSSCGCQNNKSVRFISGFKKLHECLDDLRFSSTCHSTYIHDQLFRCGSDCMICYNSECPFLIRGKFKFLNNIFNYESLNDNLKLVLLTRVSK